MDYITVGWIVTAIIEAFLWFFFFLSFHKDLKDFFKKQHYNKDVWPVMFFAIILTLVFCVPNLVLIHALSVEAHTLPYQWEAKQNEIDDIEKYLMKYDNITITQDLGTIGSIGQGMESNELKRQLASERIELYEIEKDMKCWLENPFSPYKDIIREGMIDVGYLSD